MAEKLTIWNKMEDDIVAKIKLIITYKDMLIESGEAGDFFPCQAREVEREVVVEIEKKEWEDVE